MTNVLKKIFAHAALGTVLLGGAMNCASMGGSSYYNIGIRSGRCTEYYSGNRVHRDCSYEQKSWSHYDGPAYRQPPVVSPNFNRAYRYNRNYHYQRKIRVQPLVRPGNRICHTYSDGSFHCH